MPTGARPGNVHQALSAQLAQVPRPCEHPIVEPCVLSGRATRPLIFFITRASMNLDGSFRNAEDRGDLLLVRQPAGDQGEYLSLARRHVARSAASRAMRSLSRAPSDARLRSAARRIGSQRLAVGGYSRKSTAPPFMPFTLSECRRGQ